MADIPMDALGAVWNWLLIYQAPMLLVAFLLYQQRKSEIRTSKLDRRVKKLAKFSTALVIEMVHQKQLTANSMISLGLTEVFDEVEFEEEDEAAIEGMVTSLLKAVVK